MLPETGAVTLARDVMANGIWNAKGKFKGMDAFTASAVTQVADHLNPENVARLDSMPTLRAVDCVWKLVSGNA